MNLWDYNIDLIAESFTNVLRARYLQIQEVEQNPNWINAKESVARHITITLLKSNERKNLESS